MPTSQVPARIAAPLEKAATALRVLLRSEGGGMLRLATCLGVAQRMGTAARTLPSRHQPRSKNATMDSGAAAPFGNRRAPAGRKAGNRRCLGRWGGGSALGWGRAASQIPVSWLSSRGGAAA